MPHRSQRKEGQRQQKQQKLQLREHLPRQRVQRRQRERRDQRQWQGRRERREERREERRKRREKERSREAVQETIYNVYEESQTNLPHPFRQAPQIEHVQEPPVEHVQEPRVQRLPPLGNFRCWVWLLSLGLCLGYWIGRAVARRAPRATEAFQLAIRVSALETRHFVFGSLNQLTRVCAHAVSTYGGLLGRAVLLVMLAILIGHYGEMYLVREEPAEDNPDRGRDPEEPSDDDFCPLHGLYSVHGVRTNEGTPQESWVQEPDSDSDSTSGDIVARAA